MKLELDEIEMVIAGLELSKSILYKILPGDKHEFWIKEKLSNEKLIKKMKDYHSQVKGREELQKFVEKKAAKKWQK